MSEVQSEILMEARGLKKVFQNSAGESSTEVLRGIDLTIRAGESLSVVGASGSGKSTLLHLLGGLEKPTLGSISFRNQEISRLSDEKMSDFRARHMGFVFQFHHLLSELNALENVALSLRVQGVPKAEALVRAEEFLRELGLGHRLSSFPTQLSGGELQRVSIARALVKRPEILFADEPTGNLDSQRSQDVQNLFFDLKKKFNLTLVVVTHDAAFANRFERVLNLADGQWVK